MTVLQDASLLLVAAGFLLMGVAAISHPGRVTALFGVSTLGIDARNEVRAVYGGFGIAMTAALGWGLVDQDIRWGVCMTIAFALCGMAAGRIVSALLDRQISVLPGVFLCIEGLAAGLLVVGAGDLMP